MRRLCAALVLASAGCSSPAQPTAVVLPLVISCPAALTLSSPSGQPVVGLYGAPTVTGGAGPQTPPSTTCTPASGSTFSVGPTTVSCVATEAALESARCAFAVTVVAPPGLSVTGFLAFGDSITAGEISDGSTLSAIDPSLAYPGELQALLQQSYPAQPLVVVNDGLSGETAVQGAARLPGELARYHPQVLLLLEGVNDLHLSSGEAGIPPAISALQTMIQQAESSGARVVVGTLLPAVPGALSPGTPDLIVPFNAQLVPMALGTGALVVDSYSAFLLDMADWIGPDGLHPSPAGYQELAQLFFAAIQTNFARPTAARKAK